MQAGIFGSGAVEDPYPMYRLLRNAAPAVQMQPGTWAVGRYDDVLHVLKNYALFSSRILGFGFGFGASTIIGMDPPDHTKMRNLVNRAFTPRMVAALEPRLREITKGLLDEIAPTGRLDLIADLAIPVPVIIISEILGIDPERRDDFKRWSDAFVFSGVASIDGRAGIETARREFDDYFSKVIDERRRAPKDDLISALTRAEGEDALTPAEVMSFTVLLLIAGNETTTNLIGNAVVALLKHPEQLERVRRDPSLVPNLVEEALRWDSPVQVLIRMTTQEVDLSGVTIPAGAMVMPMFASANRDERQFPDPDAFDVGRANARDHLAFGQGPHFCLGAPLARLEGLVVLEQIVQRLPGLERSEDKLERLDSFLLRGPKRLPLKFDAAAAEQASAAVGPAQGSVRA